MPIETRYEEDLKLIRSVYTGPCGMEDYLRNTQRILELSSKHGTEKCFLDMRLLENKADYSDIMEFPDLYRKLNAPANLTMGLLIVPGQKDQTIIGFYETVCMNRGWNTRTFSDPDQLLDWLLQS